LFFFNLGFGGADCSDILSCNANTCQNGGICSINQTTNLGVCTCKPGYLDLILTKEIK
jgi:hypothetical protein